MPRGLSAEVITEISKTGVEVIYPRYFFHGDFVSGELNLWTGKGNISLTLDGESASKTFTGAADLMGIGSWKETLNMQAEKLPLTLSGVPADVRNLALGEYYQGRTAKLWTVFFDENGDVMTDGGGDPVNELSFVGLMDVMNIDDSGSSSTIQLTIESPLRELDGVSLRRYVPYDQIIDYPNDKGFNFLAAWQERKAVWED